MADQNPHGEQTPKEIGAKAMGVDLDEAAGRDASARPDAQGQGEVHSGPPQANQQEIAEQTRMEQDQREVDRTREQRLLDDGRGRHTTGRMGGVS